MQQSTSESKSENDDDKDLLSNQQEDSCPTLLIKRGNKLMLFNKNMPEIRGENPIFFDGLDQYIDYVNTQKKLYNENCPVLFLQEEVNAQGENVYRMRKTNDTNVDPLMIGSVHDYFKNHTDVMPVFAPPSGPSAFNKPPANHSLPLANYGVQMKKDDKKLAPKLTPYKDSNRDGKPFNQVYHGFDPSNQYVGRYTILDQIHDSTKVQNKNGLSDNPMDPNWGGVVFTEDQVKKGKYEENEVQPPNGLKFGEYPKSITTQKIETPKQNETKHIGI